MAFSFEQTVSIGDILPNNKYSLYFPTLPNGVEGKTLTLRNAGVSLPTAEVGQIVVKTFGWGIAFAGRRSPVNTFSATFVETLNSPTMHSLYGWQDMCSGFKSSLGSKKSEYAVNVKLVVKDNTGKYALECKLHNVWPKSITLDALAEDSSALEVSVDFSLDAVDLIDLDVADAKMSDLQTGFAPIKDTTYSGASFSATPNGMSSRAQNPLTALNVGGLLAGSFGGFNISTQFIDKVMSGVGGFVPAATSRQVAEVLQQAKTGLSTMSNAADGLTTILPQQFQNAVGLGNINTTLDGATTALSNVTSVFKTFFG